MAFGKADRASQYRRAADEIKAGMDRHLYRKILGRFPRMIETVDGKIVVDETVDSSLYGLFAFVRTKRVIRGWPLP